MKYCSPRSSVQLAGSTMNAYCLVNKIYNTIAVNNKKREKII